ncbi:PIN domain-containing protein [Pseudomonas syringae]|uniref:PIN domain-containing protein n=1 Tax=Pseudomonas syringae TaxID=317 RepID=UPI003F777F24
MSKRFGRRVLVTHLSCLLEAQQFKTFDEVLARVEGFKSSVSLMNLCSLKNERMGNIQSALEISDHIISLTPDSPYSWYRGCYLRYRYRSLKEQRVFQARVSDSLLQRHSREAAAILFFMARAGDFKRAEAKWVEWFIQDPRGLAIDFIDFYFSLSMGGQTNIEVSLNIQQCLGAVQFTQDGIRRTKLIVDDYLDVSECTLSGSSQLGQLLLNSETDKSFDLGLVTYVVEERLPPYIACMRMAAQLRHTHNDGSDSFAIMETPSEPAELLPFLEEKLGRGIEGKSRLRAIKDIPLFIRGHGLHSDNAFKAALNCWADIRIPKSFLHANGDADPKAVVLDAYSIGYLAVTDLAQRLLDVGIKFILPLATKEGLGEWIEQISDENFMMMGITDTGKLYSTTASDIQARDGHVLRALNLILDNSTVGHLGPHNAPLDIYSIRDGVDRTVYDAMELSSTSNTPWLCMDAVFAALHGSSGRPVVNAYSLIIQAMAIAPFDFDHKRHGSLLYAIGSLPLPLTYAELQHIAGNPNNLAGFILFKIIQNHGRQLLVASEQPFFLLDLISAHLYGQFFSKDSYKAIYPSYTLAVSYSAHVFNHGMELFLTAYDKESVEYRFAVALGYICWPININQDFLKYILDFFIRFAQGHFLDLDVIKDHLLIIATTNSEHS